MRPLRTGILLFLFLTGVQAQPNHQQIVQTFAQMGKQINTFWGQGKMREAVALLNTLAANPDLSQIPGARADVLSSLAKGYAVLGNIDSSLINLAAAVREGFSDYEDLLSDADLGPVRSNPRFAEIVAPLKRSYYRWESPSTSSSYHDTLSEAEQTLALSRVWAEIRYGFAYFDRVAPLDWDSLYVANLKEVNKKQATGTFYRSLQKMVGQLHDGHTRVDPPNELFRKMYAHPSLQTRMVEGKVLIVNVLRDSLRQAGILPGMEIREIDGLPAVESAGRFVEPFQSSSTEQGRLTNVYEYYLLCGAPEQPVRLQLAAADGKVITRELKRDYFRFQNYKKSVELSVLQNGVAVLAVNSFADRSVRGQLDSLFSIIRKCRGLILDLRENSGGLSDIAYELLGYLVDTPFKTVKGEKRSYEAFARAMRLQQSWTEYPSTDIQPHGSGAFQKPVAVLMTSRTGSSSEDFCAAFKDLKRGVLIGTPSAGSTGQPLFYKLPGGGTGVVCTMRISSPSGSDFNGLGIQPDIRVPETIRDVRSGTDTPLDVAVKEILKTRE